MTEPTPRRRLRAGDADRERALPILQDAYSAGRLDLPEAGQFRVAEVAPRAATK